MQAALSRYLLFCEGGWESCPDGWRFLLESVETGSRFAAKDREPISSRNRLELLAVVRGLESLDGPSHVTLVTASRYVAKGLRTGLEQWRSHGWNWERFGRIVPIRDGDLWQRVDRALEFHKLVCRCWSLPEHEDSAEMTAEPPKSPQHPISAELDAHPFIYSPGNLRCRESTAPALAGA